MQKKSILVLIFLVLLSHLTFAQQPGEISYHDESVLPAGKIGERIQSLIATLNSGDPVRIQQFIQNECTTRFQKFASMEEHINVFKSILHEWGGAEFHSIRTYVPERKGSTIVIVKDLNFGSWRAFTLRFDMKDDYLIAGLGFNDARTPSNVQESDLTEKEFIQKIKDRIPVLCQKEVFSGSLLIAKGNQILLLDACGEASKRFHVPNNSDTKFNLGSMNKMFTSAAIVQLQEKGKLSFEDTLDKYLDETWLPKDITSTITLHHLLTHTSGLGSYFNRKYAETSRQKFRALDDYKPLIKDDKPAFTPGERFRYSNTGMFLLGVVIEKVTGQSYFDYIREHIYVPADMENSGCYEMDFPVENLAIGYSPDPDSPYGWQNNLYKHTIKGGPAGGGFSTVGDLHKFAIAILAGKLVSKESLEIMWKAHSENSYGYGFGIEAGPNGKVVGHSGGFAGINSNLDIFVDKGYVVAVMSNIDGGASGFARYIAKLLERVK